MFSYQQLTGNLLLTDNKKPTSRHVSQELLVADLLVELGHINLAEKEAYEVLEASNESPWAMENLVNIYLARGNYDNASIILNVLRRDLAYRKRSQQLLKLIEEDGISQIEEISQIRSVMSTFDSHYYAHETEQLMLNLLGSNPNNRIALEYLAAYYLINGQMKKIEEIVSRFKDAGYAQLPRHIQEAILLIEQRYKEKPDIKGYSINPEVRRRFNKFKQLSASMNKAAVKQKLLPLFGDTYYFYYLFPKYR
jgi:predicted Zn-dependent protease